MADSDKTATEETATKPGPKPDPWQDGPGTGAETAETAENADHAEPEAKEKPKPWQD